MNKSVTFTVKIRTLVLAAVAFIAVVGISQTLIASNSHAVMSSDGYINVVAVNGKIYAVERDQYGRPFAKPVPVVN